MAITVRLNDKEQELLRRKCIDLNKQLINNSQQPIKDSELVHKILDKAIDRVELTASGNIEIR